MTEPVSCAQFEHLAVLYALGELDEPARADIEEHARGCPACAAVLQRETALTAILGAASQPPGDGEPSDLLLARCRDRLAASLDKDTAALRPGIWSSLFSLRDWIAMLRLSPKFSPAWSIAALLVVGAVSGLAGWEGVGRSPWGVLGPTVMTVSAASPPPVAPVVPTAAHAAAEAVAQPQPTAREATEKTPVYAAMDAGMNDAFSRGSLDAQSAQVQRQAPSMLRQPQDEAMPHTRRHQPPLRMPPGLSQAEARDTRPSGSLEDISRRMEMLWWGGVRVDPSEQQQRLVVAPLPDYPEVARRAGIEGQVTLLLRIGKDGSVGDVELLSGEPVLGRAAAEAVDQWRYSPLRISGQPVNVLTSVTLAFELR